LTELLSDFIPAGHCLEQVVELEHVVESPAAAAAAAAGFLASGCGRGVRGWSVASGGGSGGWQWSS